MQRFTTILVALLVASSVVTASYQVQEPGRMGCFEDNSARVWKQWENTYEKNTVQFCKNLCQEFAYAGLQAGQYCMCGKELPTKVLPDSRCNMPCFGDHGQTCGGDWAFEVFAVDPKPMKVGEHKGCFLDSKDRVWKNGVISLQSASSQRWINACRGFKFAGLEAGYACFCGNDLPSTPLPMERCQDECNGCQHKICGGAWALDVFEITDDEYPIITGPTWSSTLPNSECYI